MKGIRVILSTTRTMINVQKADNGILMFLFQNKVFDYCFYLDKSSDAEVPCGIVFM